MRSLGNAMEKYAKSVRIFADSEKSLDEIRNHLKKFVGGSVDLTKRDGLAIVTLNQESRKNAMTGKMMADLEDVVKDLESWKDGKGIILKGANGNFCSGGDLDFARQTGTAEEGFMMATAMHDTLSRFQKLPLVSVALIEGSGAIGGGAEISTACDFRLISEKCQGIGFVHGRMGLVPAWGGTMRLVHHIGYNKALDLLCTARIVNPTECVKLGLAYEIIPDGEDNLDYAKNWLLQRTKFNSEIVRSFKVSCSAARDFADSYEIERRIFAPFWGGPLNKEALSKNIKHKAGDENS